MKLRVRFDNLKQSINVDEDIKTIDDLKRLISTQIRGLPNEFCLSLNGSSAVCNGGGNQLLGDAGIVSGDLLHLIPVTKDISSYNPIIEDFPVEKENSRSQELSGQTLPEGMETQPASEEVLMQLEQPDDAEIPPEFIGRTPKHLKEEDVDISTMARSLSLVTSKFEKLLPSSPQRSLVVILHCLMTELGFRLDLEAQEAADEEFDPYAISLDFVHPTFDRMTFQLLLITMMDECMLHGSSRSNGEVLSRDSLQISPNRLFEGISIEEELDGKKFEGRLVVLRKTFRDRIGNNFRQCALRLHGFPEMAELSTLPYVVQLRLLDFVNVPGLLRLSETSTYWRSLCMEQSVWKKKYRQLTGGKGVGIQTKEWLELYKKTYKEQKETSRRHHHHHHHHFIVHPPHRHPFHGHHHHHHHPPHHPFPGVIGGEWDVNPGGFSGPRSVFPRTGRPEFGGAFDPLIPGFIRPGIGGGFDLEEDHFGLQRGPMRRGKDLGLPKNLGFSHWKM